MKSYKRFLKTLTVGACLLPFSVSASDYYGVINGSGVNIRKSPGTGSVVKSVSTGTTFDMPNKADTAKKTISMLAEDMAARVGQDLSDVNELCIFWDVPYLESDAKTQFERKDNGMAIGDQVFNF